ncbi:MAG TPA: flagellar motor switch protein FliG [Verrucomicrobiae bacterium]|nr:flagellar motor switch protein FliG [Verrucomicrobiae bacterium]
MTTTPATLDLAKLTRVEKLAALLVILGPEPAAEILKGFDHREVADITTAMMAMPVIDQPAQQAILAEFSEVAVAATTALRGGVEFAQTTLERALGSAQAKQIMGRVAPSQAANSPIRQIVERDPLQIFNALKTEQPQTVALVLSLLHPKKASAVLNLLADDTRDQVVERLATLGPTPVEVVETVGELLVKKMGATGATAFNETGGLPPAANLLKALGRDASNVLLAAIENRNPELGQSLRKQMFRFEDIAKLEVTDLQKILREVDSRTLATALKPVPDTIKAKILSGLSKRAAEALEEEISFLGKIKAKDIDVAQTAIVDVVRRLEANGQIEIESSAAEA